MDLGYLQENVSNRESSCSAQKTRLRRTNTAKLLSCVEARSKEKYRHEHQTGNIIGRDKREMIQEI
jgi:hypothetical protein